MESTLTVRNFGPIKDATLNMRNVNVLIGPQASGKSTLAKLYTICKSPSCYNDFESNRLEDIKLSKDKFLEKLKHYSIFDFLNVDSEIIFNSPTHNFNYNNGRIIYDNKLSNFKLTLDDENIVFEENLKRMFELSESLEFNIFFTLFLKTNPKPNEINFKNYSEFERKYNFDNINSGEKQIIIEEIEKFKSSIFFNDALYVPAERTILNLLKQASFSFQNLKIPIPQHLIAYGYKYEVAANELLELDLNFINKKSFYKYEDNIDRIYFSKGKSVKLSESASSFQSIIPILLPIINERKNQNKQYSFVIEEPETNLYPKAQYELIKFLEKDREDDLGRIDRGSIHTYTTHSPFILTSLNNMLYAFKKGNNENKEVKEKIASIISRENWINPDLFSAYEIKNGKALSIFDRKTGLIRQNSIDIVSEEIIEDFRKIALATL